MALYDDLSEQGLSDQEACSDEQDSSVDAENSGNIILRKPELLKPQKSSSQDLSIVSEEWDEVQETVRDQEQVSGQNEKSANIDEIAAEFD